MNFFTQFLGRFHPLLVHLPIGILLLAFLFEALSLRKQVAYLKLAVQPALLIGAIAAAVSCITGYFLSLEGGYTEKLLVPHQYLGIATAILAFALFFLRDSTWMHHFSPRYAGVVSFLPVVIALSFTGHLGGSLTHGDEYLSFDITGPMEETTTFKPINNVDQAVVYSDVVQPILKTKCYSCHSAKKQKGDLRLDEIPYIQRGGEHGEIIVAGTPDSSLLYNALLLPLEHDNHMPPKGKPQLTSTEIAILQNWIEEGASFEKKVSDFSQPAKMKAYIATLNTVPSEHWVPTDNVGAADARAVASLKSQGVLVLPVAHDNNFITINFINKRAVTDEDLKTLGQLKDQVLWLNLAGTSIRDDQLPEVAGLEKLRWLYLNNTQISDKGIKELIRLKDLMVINMVNTQVTDQGLAELQKMPQLKKLFVYNTGITADGIARLRDINTKLNIDTGGYALPRLASDSIVFKRKI